MHATFLAIAVFLALAVHEIGHALGGSLRGLRLTMLIVGPVHIQRGTDGRLCWRLNRKLSYAGGMVWSAPQSTAGLRRAMLCFAAGGPVTSIVVGGLVLAIYMLWELPGATLGIHGSFRDALSLGVFTLGAASFGIGFVALLPRNQGTFVNDGRQILSLRRAGAAADRYAAGMALGGCMMACMRPRDWDPELVAQVISLADASPEDLAGRRMAHEHALDRGDIQGAGEHIRYMVGHIGSAPMAWKSVINVDAAYFEAAYRRDAVSARRRLTRVWQRPVYALDPTASLRAEGAVLLAEGDAARAFDKLREAYAALASGRDWSSEFAMVEIRRLCRARGLPDPEAGHPVK